MGLVIREDSLAVFFKGFPGVCVFASQRSERLPGAMLRICPRNILEES